MLPGRRAYDQTTLGLLEQAGRNVEKTTMLLRHLIAEWPERPELAREVLDCEHDGDRITHDIIHRLDGGGSGPVPFDAGDGHALATALDDIVDEAENTADLLATYHVEASMEQAAVIADVLVGCGEQVARAVACLRNGNEIAPHLVEIHRLENEADRLSRDAIAALFHDGIDPMVVIRWKDIFEALEASVDACETVAHVLEGISLKRRRRRS